MLKKEFDELNEKVQRMSLQAIEDVKERFASLKNASYTKKYHVNHSSSLSTNRYSTMFHSIKND